MPSDKHLPARTLRAYRDGRLEAVETLAVSDHLVDCPECRDTLARLDNGPGYDELAAAVDGPLDPAASDELAARLAEAPAAAAELADLQRFKREMGVQTGRVYGPSSVPPPEVRQIVTPPAATWRARAWPVLAVAAAVVILVVSWWAFHAAGPSAGDRELLVDRSGERADLMNLPADLRGAVERTLHDGHPEPLTADEAALHPPGTTLAGPAAPAVAFRVLAPAGVVIRELRPTLRWEAHPDAAYYYVTLAKLDGTDDRISPMVRGESWNLPEPLLPGATYRWQVEAVRIDGETVARTPVPPAPDARFQVLSDLQRNELASVEARFGSFPLVLATAYARAGLGEAAAAQWSKLTSEHPDSALARRLCQEALAAQSPAPIRTKGAQ